MLSAVLILLAVLALTLYLRGRETPEKTFGIYTQPGKWFRLKYSVFYLLMFVRRLKRKLRPISEKDLEKSKPLSSHEKAFDAVFFQAVCRNSDISLCGGLERRHQAKANGLLYIVIPEFGLLESPKLPNTLLDADPGSLLLTKDYEAEGIRFAPITPMKKWHMSYNGKMRPQKQKEALLDVKLEAEWTTDFPYFMFETDMNLESLSKAMAREVWTKEFFQALKNSHQSHYEQMGYLNGTLTIDNKKYKLEMEGFRDHSFGYKRDWGLMHRYAFHMFYLEDGTRISMGIVSQPCTTSHLEMGYIILPDKTISSIKNCDLYLYQHGENGTPPQNYSFSFKASSQIYEAKVTVEHQAHHFKGTDNEAKLFERFITCEVNGLKGKGISEWHYNSARYKK